MSKAPIPTAQTERTSRRAGSLALATAILGFGLWTATPGSAQEPTLDESCVVSVLNRTAPVDADGAWVLPNVPAGIGQVRMRATCVDDGVTRGGQSDVFTVPADGVIRVQEIRFDAPVPVPERLEVSAAEAVLTSPGQTLQLRVDAHYADGTSAELSSAADGTNYIVTNPAVATVSPDGLVTAVASGTVIVSAMNEGASGFLRLQVVLSGDSDGDGIPDDVEVGLGLDPNDPVDALLDPDGDGLTNADEVGLGTDPNAADTDGDGLLDGEEVELTGTDAVLFDTDGDGLSDGLEIATGSDPLDPASYDLAAALTGISVRPGSFVLNSNTVLPGDASVALTVEGALLDGTTIDLTSAGRGTGYTSSDLLICNFGLENGVVFAGGEGVCTITVSNSGFTASAEGLVQEFTPGAVSAVNLPAYGNSVAVRDGWAFVAGGAGGLTVVDVMDYRRPRVVTSLALPGNANDVVLAGSLAYVAGGEAGVHVVDVSVPEAPALVASLDTPGSAIALRTAGDHLYVADGADGLQVIDLSDPVAPVWIGSWDTPGQANGIAVAGALAVVSTHTAPVEIIDVSTPSAPVGLSILLVTGTTFDVEILGSLAYVATSRDLRVIDLTDPQVPVDLGSFGANLWMIDLLAAREDLIFTTQVIPSTRMPIFDLREDPEAPVFAGVIEFSRLGQGNGDGLSLAADEHFVYMTASAGYEVDSKPGSTGATRLLIAQYEPFEDDVGEAPAVVISAPGDGAEVAAETPFEVTVDAEDDIGVVDVTITVDGAIVARDAFRPYRVLVDPPVAGSSVRIGAVARDFGGNQGEAAEITVHVSGGAGTTTVIGSVVAPAGGPASGARVFTSMGGEATSAIDGTFRIEQLPVTAAQLVAFGTTTVGGEELRGRSTSAPVVAGGVTDVGVIELSQLGILFPGPTSPMSDSPPIVKLLEVADFNQDGILDTVAASVDQLAVLLGRGDGTFEPRIDLTAPTVIADLTIGDVDDDGRIDLVLVDRELDELWVQLGQGDGTFASPVVTSVPARVSSVGVGDVDLDGFLDAVVGSTSGAQAHVFRGRGDGTFDIPSSAPLPAASRQVGLGDLDGDGILDLVSLWELAVSFGQGDGTFEAAMTLLPGDFVRDFVIEDLNADGLLDLLGVESFSSSSTLTAGHAFLSRDGGGFDRFYVGFLGDTPVVTMGDLDLDGIPDLVGTEKHSGWHTASVWLGPDIFEGPGANYPLWTEADVGDLGGLAPMIVASMDGDGVPDLVVGRAAGGVSVFSGDGTGRFRTYERNVEIVFGSRLYPGDLDGDGLTDLVTASSSTVRTYFQNQDGTFRLEAEIPVAAIGWGLVADLNFDGALDVAIFGSSTLSVLLNTGAGALSPPVEYDGPSGLGRPNSGDVTGDGFLDLVFTRGGQIGVFVNDGDGGFLPPTSWSIGGTFSGLDLADFDADGDLDAVLSDSGEGELILAVNDGSGGFSRWATLPVAEVESGFFGSVSSEPRVVRAVDMDRDGLHDLISVNRIGRDVSLFRGLGGGSFGAEERFPVGIGPLDQAIVDVDLDGLLDLVVINTGSDDLSVLRGREDGSFTPEERYTTGGAPRTVEIFLRAGSAFPSLAIGANTGSTGGKAVNFLVHE